jgi:hypothetical protein
VKGDLKWRSGKKDEGRKMKEDVAIKKAALSAAFFESTSAERQSH